ncbi:MAG: DUF4976 domain-containing protein [Fuerstiella sp.]
MLSTDFFPTILELAGLPLTPDLHADGVSLLPLLRGKTLTTDRPLCWHYPHYHGSTWPPGAAIRDGDWKLIEFYEFAETELYHLAQDPGEQHDLSTFHPQKVAELQNKLPGWQQQMNARMPQPDPSWDPDAPFLPPAGNTGRKR